MVGILGDLYSLSVIFSSIQTIIGIEAILFSADFEMAFDLIDHTFLYSVISHMGSALTLFNGSRLYSITRKVV